MLNCGECLIKNVEIVSLEDGVCKKCKTIYGKQINIIRNGKLLYGVHYKDMMCNFQVRQDIVSDKKSGEWCIDECIGAFKEKDSNLVVDDQEKEFLGRKLYELMMEDSKNG